MLLLVVIAATSVDVLVIKIYGERRYLQRGLIEDLDTRPDFLDSIEIGGRTVRFPELDELHDLGPSGVGLQPKFPVSRVEKSVATL